MRVVIGGDNRIDLLGSREAPMASGKTDGHKINAASPGALNDPDVGVLSAVARAPFAQDPAKTGTVVLIEGAEFLRECVARGLAGIFPDGVETYASTEIFLAGSQSRSDALIVLSTASMAQTAVVQSVGMLLQTAAGAPVLVLSYRNDVEIARAVLELGAKGFIPGSMDFALVLETARFVAAGGTYMPTELLSERRASVPQGANSMRAVTQREMEVVRAIRQGKPNKVIAHELNMCESTVKVHVRHVMKKLQARNRTDIAIKSAELVGER